MDFISSDLIFTIALFLLVVFAVLGIAWGLFYPKLSKNYSRDQRMQAVALSRVQISDKRMRAASADRRKDIEANLKQMENQQKKGKNKKQSLSSRLDQAGLTITTRQFWIYSMISGAVCFLGALLGGLNTIVALGVGIVGLVGLPHFWVARKRKKRLQRFIAEFPNAVDVIVRGIKTGLPLGDCLVIAASETSEPVRSEFRRLVDEQAMGLPLAKVVPRLHQRIPLPETNFFAIVIIIQTQAGGSLSEALGNLSRVLRARAQMKEKVSAMSMEAKASAAIIGAMPFVIAFLIYLTNSSFIMIMFEETMGLMMLGAALAWMLIGVLVMKTMISFDI
ncbi:type II secretion system F family protein [uncultured Cohaesibacter sp.]|uniref:type II secretion system F family protein n=1 Tax=uncultured Cohaesibacter sp. TaxID=1002546 RepID=UPI00292E21C5|nr:type II secretion system F family protein [uncultured Cohaesibacter sp.]